MSHDPSQNMPSVVSCDTAKLMADSPANSLGFHRLMSSSPVWLAVASLYVVCAVSALCRFAPQIGQRFGLLDHPGDLKQHSRATPLLGGLALFATLLPLLPFFVVVSGGEGGRVQSIGTIVVATIMVTVIGTLDDRKHMRPAVRFMLALVIFSLALVIEPQLVIWRLQLSIARGPFLPPYYVSYILTLLILVGFVNSVNMADGKNGIVIALNIFWLTFLLWKTPPELFPVIILLIQMLVIFLISNLRGQVFLGDGGTYGLSAFVGMISIYVYNSPGAGISADNIALLFLVPGIDMLRLFFFRLLARRSPFRGDRNHFHHLLERHLGWPAGLYCYLAIATAPTVAALVLPQLIPLIFIAGLAIYVLLVAGMTISKGNAVGMQTYEPDELRIGGGGIRS